MSILPEPARDLVLLESIEKDPDVSQLSLASQLDVAVGTVNWHLKRLIEKGFVKIKRAERKKLRYIITPEGIALRARLTVDYIDQQFRLYRKTREKVGEYLGEIQRSGFNHVRLMGEGDVADICKLTCLEQGVSITQDTSAPILEVTGLSVIMKPGGQHGG